jgi:hypothetical protein
MWSDEELLGRNLQERALSRKRDPVYGHTIPLAETDAIRGRLTYRLDSPFDARSAERNTPIARRRL